MEYPSEEEQKAFYDADTHLRVRNGRLIDIEHYITSLIKRYPKIKTVLEVGCGVGITSRFMHTSGLQVVGVDISKKHIEKCRQLAPGAIFVCDNFVRVPIIDGGPPFERPFDLITFFDILEHIPKPQHEEVFDQVVLASRVDTKVTIIIPEPKRMDELRKTDPELLQPVDESIYPEDIEPLFEGIGINIIESEESGGYVKYLLERT